MKIRIRLLFHIFVQVLKGLGSSLFGTRARSFFTVLFSAVALLFSPVPFLASSLSLYDHVFGKTDNMLAELATSQDVIVTLLSSNNEINLEAHTNDALVSILNSLALAASDKSRAADLNETDFLQAFNDITKTNNIDIDDPGYFRLQAITYSLSNDSEMQIDSLNRGLNLHPNDPGLLYEKAKYLIHSFKYDEGKELFERVSSILVQNNETSYPNEFSVRIALSNYDYWEGSNRELLSLYEEAIAYFDNAESVTFEVILLEKMSYVVGHKYVATSGTFGEAALRYRLVGIYSALGMHENAERQLHYLSELENNILVSEEELITLKTLVYMSLGKFDDALEGANELVRTARRYGGLIQRSPGYYDALCLKGITLAAMQKWDSAEAFLDRCIFGVRRWNYVRSDLYKAASLRLAGTLIIQDKIDKGYELITDLSERAEAGTTNFEDHFLFELAKLSALYYILIDDQERFNDALNESYLLRPSVNLEDRTVDADMYFLEAARLQQSGRIAEALSLKARALSLIEGREDYFSQLVRSNFELITDN